MADFFETSLGVSITDDNDTEVLHIISSNGAPGVLQIEDDAPRGSISVDNLTGEIYTKTTAGIGTAVWTKGASITDLNNAVNGQSWREPAIVRDNTLYANLAAAEAAVNTGTVDGVTVSDQDRILFDNITGSNANVYIVTGTPGAGATLVEDTNLATDGDALYIQDGTDADQQYAYNGTTWVQSGSGSSTEIGFIRAYIGKPVSGSVLPQYTSNNYILDNDDLTAALGKIDAQVGTNAANIAANVTSITNLQTEVDNIEASIGTLINADGTFNGFTGTNFLDASTSVTDAFTLLDTQISNSNDDAFIRAFIGKAAAGAELPAYTSNNIVTDGNTLEDSIGDLDTFVDRERREITVAANVGQNVVDSVLVDSVKACHWWVYAQEDATQDTRAVLVHGIHDGNTANDATTTDRAEYARLRIGNVNGFRTRVTLSGAGATQVMQLEVRTNNASTLNIVRSVII